MAAIASSSAAPFATPAIPRATSAMMPSAWLFANDSARTSATRGADGCDAMRDDRLATEPRLADAGRAADGDDDRSLVLLAALVGADDLRELGLATDEGRAAGDASFFAATFGPTTDVPSARTCIS